MKRIIIIISALYTIFGLSGKVSAYEIVIAQSSNASYYEKAVGGFMETGVQSVATGGPKSIQPDTVSKFYLDDRRGRELLERRIKESKPDLLLAVGNRALEAVRDYEDITILYLLAPNGEKLRAGRSNISGVEMVASPARQLAAFAEVLPSLKNVAVIYDPANSASYLDEARSVAGIHGIRLITEKVGNPKEVADTLNRFAGFVDAFWMLPDPTVVTPLNVEAMLRFSFDNDIPILTFADKYLEVGAMVSAGLSLREIGGQAGRLARKVMAASPNGRMAVVEFPEALKVGFNHRMAAKMGVLVNTAALNSGVLPD